MLKAGFVGSGFAARIHVEGVERVGEPVAVYSPTPANREAFAADHRMAAVGSLAELIDMVDVVHVCAPASTHEVAALAAGVHVIVEKPFTGYFGAATTPHRQMLAAATSSAARMVAADRASEATLCYAENFVYAPAVRREAEIVSKTDAQILRMVGEESHSGSHSPFYGMWKHMGGGSLIGKGCHPLTAMLYLKRLEGITRRGKPILPATATAPGLRTPTPPVCAASSTTTLRSRAPSRRPNWRARWTMSTTSVARSSQSTSRCWLPSASPSMRSAATSGS